jgi:hypothetical protein
MKKYMVFVAGGDDKHSCYCQIDAPNAELAKTWALEGFSSVLRGGHEDDECEIDPSLADAVCVCFDLEQAR